MQTTRQVSKKIYRKFRNKSLANKKLLSILFFDFLTIEVHVRTSKDIINRVTTKNNKDVDTKRKSKKKRDKEKEENLQLTSNKVRKISK